MIKQLAMAALAAFAVDAVQAGGADDFNKLAHAATHLAPMESTTAGSTPHDLLLDTAFDADGLMPFWPASDATWSKVNEAIAVYPWIGVDPVAANLQAAATEHLGYYIVGKQRSVDGTKWRPWIARFQLGGLHDTSFGTNGWIFGPDAPAIVDAQMADNKVFVLTDLFLGGTRIVRVQCIDTTTPTGSNCFAGFGGFLPFGTATAPRFAAYAQRLKYDRRYGIFVTASVLNTERGAELGVARISADTGGLVSGFGTGGYIFGLPNWANPVSPETMVTAVEVTPLGYPGTIRLYIGGHMRAPTAGDRDGFILGLNPDTGGTSSGWNWNNLRIYHESDNSGFMIDAVSTLTVQRNGRIAWAGWSRTDSASVTPMIMGRRNVDGSIDTSFCAGNPNLDSTTGSCVVDPPFSTGAPFYLDYEPAAYPVGLYERSRNRDLVVVQRFANSGGSLVFPDDGHVRTLVQQYSASGNRLHASRTIDFPNYQDANEWSAPYAAWMGRTGEWAASTGLGEEVLAIAGTRLYNTTENTDGTLAHLKSTDSIFADQFGGSRGD